jgi:hypothetical protein
MTQILARLAMALAVALAGAVSAEALDLDSLAPMFRAGAGAEQAGAALLNPGECPEGELNKTRCLDLAPDTDPYKLNTYQFRVTDSRWFTPGPRTLVVTFVDEGAGMIQPQALCNDAFNGQYAGPARMRSYTRLNTGGLRRAVFEFNLSTPPPRDARHAHLTIGGLRHLVELRIGPSLTPADWDEITATIPAKVTPMVTLSRPMELTTTVGVSVLEVGENDLQGSLVAMADLAPLARVLGFTSIESYVLWRRIEPKEEGVFDFSFYDGVVEKLKAYDLKWFPLLIVGSAYALPDWFAASPENVGMVCLEHGESNAIQSIWSPWHQRHVTRVLRAFGEHYDGKGILEAVRLGPSGNFGESQYPAGGNWGLRGQKMHIHIGWWAGDPYARADFQQYLKKRYGTVAALNKAWDGTTHRAFDEVVLSLPQVIQSRQERLDLTGWYTDSMSHWCDWWSREAKVAMPGTPLYQSAGGWGFREAGTDYPAQTKTMADLGGGIRLTNETDSYEQNFYATRLATTAARLYGARIGAEPASSHTARGVSGRLFNLLACNGGHFFTYHGNLMANPLAVDLWLAGLPLLETRQPPLVEVAVYYPETMNQLEDAAFRQLYAWGFNPRAREIRRVADVDYLDETLIRDGFLDRYKALVFAWGNIIEPDVLAKIDAWVRAGGTLIYPSFPRAGLETVQGDTAVFDRWAAGDVGSGAFRRFAGDMEPPGLYGEFVAGVLKDTASLHPWTRAMVETERPGDVFLSVQADGHLIMLNYGDREAAVRLSGVFEEKVLPWHMQRTALPPAK